MDLPTRRPTGIYLKPLLFSLCQSFIDFINGGCKLTDGPTRLDGGLFPGCVGFFKYLFDAARSSKTRV